MWGIFLVFFAGCDKGGDDPKISITQSSSTVIEGGEYTYALKLSKSSNEDTVVTVDVGRTTQEVVILAGNISKTFTVDTSTTSMITTLGTNDNESYTVSITDANVKIDGNSDSVMTTIGNIAGSEILEKLKSATVKIQTNINGGTGFLINNDGYIVTNNHVVSGAGIIKVKFNGENKMISASPVAYAECADLAVLKLREDTNVDPLAWYAGDITEGIKITVAGFPWDTSIKGLLQYTLSEGIVSTQVEPIHTSWASTKSFYHTAKTAGGNSGGPVIELETGKVIGVSYASRKNKVGTSDRTYSISGKLAEEYVNRMIEGESIHSIGINPRVYLENSKSLGVLVKSVTDGGKASSIGVNRGDRIVILGGTSLLGNTNDVLKLERYCDVLNTNGPNAGAVISIRIVRDFVENNKIVRAAFCEGEINGEKLMLAETYQYNTQTFENAPNSTTPCPKF